MTEDVPVADLIPHPQNPRRGNVAAIVASIRANGWFGVLVVQRSTRYVLAGNHRLAAAVELGIEAEPVQWIDCDDRTALRILLADNRTSDLAHYSDDLDTLLRSLVVADDLTWPNGPSDVLDSLAGTGYEFGARGRMLGPIPAEVVANGRGRPRNVAIGDRFQVSGRAEHLVICGDSSTLDIDADLVVTDPPYDVPAAGVSTILTRYSDRAAVIGSATQLFGLAACGWVGRLEFIWLHGARSVPSANRPIYMHTSIGVFTRPPLESCGWSRPDPDFSSVLSPASGHLGYDEDNSHGKSGWLVGQIIRGFTSSHIVDPFLGRGATLRGADSLGIASTGIEVDPGEVAACLAACEREGMTVAKVKRSARVP
jgi:hypothetical protein